jgi:hypothetical protein
MLTLAVLGVPLYLAKKRRRDLQTVRNSGNNICHPAPNQRPSISWAALADAGIRVSGDHATLPPHPDCQFFWSLSLCQDKEGSQSLQHREPSARDQIPVALIMREQPDR